MPSYAYVLSFPDITELTFSVEGLQPLSPPVKPPRPAKKPHFLLQHVKSRGVCSRPTNTKVYVTRSFASIAEAKRYKAQRSCLQMFEPPTTYALIEIVALS